MARYYKTISGDGHCETPPVWVKYVPEKWRDRAPRLLRQEDGSDIWIIEGQDPMKNGQNITGRHPVSFSGASYYNADGSPAEGAGDAKQRLREQDEDGIDAEILFPPVFASRFLEGIKDRDVYKSMVRAYNQWLAEEYCAVAPDRLIGNSVTPVSDLEDAIAEVEFAHKAGLKSVAFYNFPNGSPFAAPEDDRFWEKCMELGIAISPHFGFGAQSPPANTPGQSTANAPYASALVQRVSGVRPAYCIAQLMAAGVFDRFPDIKFYFAEANASWMPFVLWFMDDNHEIFSTAFNGRRMKMTPSEYVFKHIYTSMVRDPLAIEMIDRGEDLIPVDNLMWGSDFPHSVGTFPTSMEYLDKTFSGKDELRKKICLDTPAAYYGLDVSKPITETPKD
jgi:predicted TIM-barrel fold metal-dependent hydrolase